MWQRGRPQGEESSSGDTLVCFFLNVIECEKRKAGSKYYRDLLEETV